LPLRVESPERFITMAEPYGPTELVVAHPLQLDGRPPVARATSAASAPTSSARVGP